MKGLGIKSYHVQPGKSATLYFIKGQSKDLETLQYPFWCDMHANMKGEFLVIETTVELAVAGISQRSVVILTRVMR